MKKCPLFPSWWKWNQAVLCLNCSPFFRTKLYGWDFVTISYDFVWPHLVQFEIYQPPRKQRNGFPQLTSATCFFWDILTSKCLPERLKGYWILQLPTNEIHNTKGISRFAWESIARSLSSWKCTEFLTKVLLQRWPNISFGVYFCWTPNSQLYHYNSWI